MSSTKNILVLYEPGLNVQPLADQLAVYDRSNDNNQLAGFSLTAPRSLTYRTSETSIKEYYGVVILFKSEGFAIKYKNARNGLRDQGYATLPVLIVSVPDSKISSGQSIQSQAVLNEGEYLNTKMLFCGSINILKPSALISTINEMVNSSKASSPNARNHPALEPGIMLALGSKDKSCCS